MTTSYSYDAAGRLTSVTAAGKTTTYGYDANGNLTTQTNPNGTTVTQTFDAADELTSLVNKKSDASTLSQFSYTYNSDGLRSQLNETLGSQTATVIYTYDALHRLTDEVRTGADTYENHFTYDAAGNRLTWNWGTGSTTYTYDAADRLTQEGNTTYTYNANGSRLTKTTSGSTTSYSYDFDEQLMQVVSPVMGTSRFTYDGLGRRVSRTAGGVTTTFHFSGNSITTETQGANVVAHYVYGVNRVSRDASGSFEYYHADGIGSTRQLSNDSQSVTQTTTYDAFGNVESSAGSSSNAYKYAGQWGYRSDGDDGLMHVGARYYDPLVGRFISADTYLGEIENPQSLNLYNYCEADPVNHADPTGHSPDGPGGTTYRIDWHEQPNPDMHIYHGGDETNVTHRGGWRRGMHRGKKLVPLAKSLRKLYRPIIKRFVKAAAKRIPFVGIGIIGYELYQTWRNPHSTWKDYALALL